MDMFDPEHGTYLVSEDLHVYHWEHAVEGLASISTSQVLGSATKATARGKQRAGSVAPSTADQAGLGQQWCGTQGHVCQVLPQVILSLDRLPRDEGASKTPSGSWKHQQCHVLPWQLPGLELPTNTGLPRYDLPEDPSVVVEMDEEPTLAERYPTGSPVVRLLRAPAVLLGAEAAHLSGQGQQLPNAPQNVEVQALNLALD